MRTSKQIAAATEARTGSSATSKGAMRVAAAAFLALLAELEVMAEVLVPAGAVWRYLDNGSDQGTAWQAPAFDDALWQTGNAQLGYGDNDEAARVSFGPLSTNKYITTYFRHAFTMDNPAVFTNLTLSLLRDDGAVVYLNGREVARQNMPATAITYRTLASAGVSGAAEATFYDAPLAATNLVAGVNVLAVEVHQNTASSSDLSFDLRLIGNRPPVTATLHAPADGAANVSTSPTLEISMPDPQGASLTVTVQGRRVGAAPGPDFTIIALPDTQNYVATNFPDRSATAVAQIEWIIANQAPRNIAFVTQLGDCVQNGDNGGDDTEWRRATNAFYRLENPATTLRAHGIPYGIAVGNHDQSPFGNADGTSRFYNEYFGVPHFTGRDYYGGNWGVNNDNHYELFSAGGLDFLAVHLEYDDSPDTNVLAWADGLLKTHASRRAIVISHWIINAGFNATFSAQGQAIYNALKGNPNLFLMLCGHVSPEEGQRTDVFDGRTVYTLMSDYQSRANGGNGWLRLLAFSPANDVIRVQTYSPTLGQFERDADSEFTLDYDMHPAGPFTALATFTGVTTATNLGVAWPGLAEGAAYEWRVLVTSGTMTSRGAIRRFTTASNQPPQVSVANVAALAGFGGAASYTVEVAANDPDGAVSKVELFVAGACLGERNAAPFSFSWNNVTAGTYTLCAIALDNGGLRATSAPVNVTVLGGGYPGDETVAAPANLSAAATASNRISLRWTDASSNEDGFAVERSDDGATFTRIALLGANMSGFTDGDVHPATRYFYRVSAFSSARASDFSNVAEATTPAGAENSSAALRLSLQLDRATGGLRLSWPSAAGTVYQVMCKAAVSDEGWVPASDELTALGPTTEWLDMVTPTAPHRFYAVRIVR
jgi:hypothetical protein